jgi:hypothetical protein
MSFTTLLTHCQVPTGPTAHPCITITTSTTPLLFLLTLHLLVNKPLGNSLALTAWQGPNRAVIRDNNNTR